MSALVAGPELAMGRAVRRPVASVPSMPRAAGARRPAAPGTLRLTVRGRRVVALLAVALVGLVSLVGGRAFADAPARALEVQTYSVAAGDTLWALATTLARPGEDVRDVVDEIVDLNGLAGAELTVGQRLVVPVER